MEGRAFVLPCVAFAWAAESLVHKQKGDGLIVIGRLRTVSWQKDGAAQSRLVLVNEKVQHLAATPKSATPGARAPHARGCIDTNAVFVLLDTAALAVGADLELVRHGPGFAQRPRLFPGSGND